MTRIQHIVMLLSNAFGPDPRVLKEAKSLTRAGYRVNIIAWDRTEDFPPHEVVDGITVQRIHVKTTYGAGTSQALYLPRFWRRAYGLLAVHKPAVIHCHDLDTMPAGYIFARSRGIPLIFDAHECYPDQMRPQVNPVMYYALVMLERFMVKKSAHVLTVGKLLADRFQRMGAKEVTIVGNYQPLGAYDETTAADRNRYQLPKDTLVVAYIGGFTRERQLQSLVEASALVDGVTILLAGDGPQRAALEATVADHPNAKYIGWIQPAQIPALTKSVDTIYYGLRSNEGNSRYSTPNSLFNAMAAGKPVLTTNVGEIASVVAEEECGIVVSDSCTQSIADALEKLKDEKTRTKMSEKSTEAAKRRYNWAAAEKALLNVYKTVT